MQSQEQKSELRIAIEESLSELLTLLDTNEQKRIAKAIGKSHYTVNRYLNGDAADLAVANKLIEAANALLQKRKQELQKI